MGSGHTFYMISILKSNRSWLPKRKSYKEIRAMYQANLAARHIDFKNATPKQLLEIKKDLLLYNKKKARNSIILILVIVLTTLACAYVLLA